MTTNHDSPSSEKGREPRWYGRSRRFDADAPTTMLRFAEEPIGGHRVPVIRWHGGRRLRLFVQGHPVPDDGRDGVRAWQAQVEAAVRTARADDFWPDCESASYALSPMFALDARDRISDTDNLAKPVIDAVARGLFPPGVNTMTLASQRCCSTEGPGSPADSLAWPFASREDSGPPPTGRRRSHRRDCQLGEHRRAGPQDEQATPVLSSVHAGIGACRVTKAGGAPRCSLTPARNTERESGSGGGLALASRRSRPRRGARQRGR